MGTQVSKRGLARVVVVVVLGLLAALVTTVPLAAPASAATSGSGPAPLSSQPLAKKLPDNPGGNFNNPPPAPGDPTPTAPTGMMAPLVTNLPPPTTTNVSPLNTSSVHTVMPALTVQPVTDPEGGAVVYWFRIATGADAESGAIINSGWISGTTWIPQDGMLQDGVTYFWHAYTWDGGGQISPASAVWAFQVNKRLGSSGLSPYDNYGPVAVNLATGNVSTDISGPQLATVGGPVGVGLSYNSQAPTANGLTGT